MNESTMQAILMRYAMDWKKHQLAVPNITMIYPWEADLVSATKSWLVHEYEIKVSRADYLADANKKSKHADLAHGFTNGLHPRQSLTMMQRRLIANGARDLSDYNLKLPNYFWYVINGFDDSPNEVPVYAGLLRVDPSRGWWQQVVVEKLAPRIHAEKLGENKRLDINRWLSFKLKNLYLTAYLKEAM